VRGREKDFRLLLFFKTMNNNKNLNTEPTTEILSIEPPKRSWWKYAVGVLAIVLVILGGYIVWYQYFSPEAGYRREVEKSALELPAKLEAYKKAREADTYGGKTPEETLQMFIEALRNEDVDLAYKYFVLEENSERDYKWLEGLRKTKDAGELQELADRLSLAKPDLESRVSENDYKFTVVDKNGQYWAYIDMRFNGYSGVWKIKSL